MTEKKEELLDDLHDLEGRQSQNVNYLKDQKDKKQELPDAYLHQRISFIKSAIRLGACAFGFFGMFEIAPNPPIFLKLTLFCVFFVKLDMKFTNLSAFLMFTPLLLYVSFDFFISYQNDPV